MSLKLVYNLADMPENDIVPPGKYLAKLIEIEEATSKSGNKMLVCTWQIMSAKCKGRKLVHYISLQEHMKDRVGRVLKALGYKGKVNLKISELLGKKACLEVTKKVVSDKDSGDGDEYARISKILPASKFQEGPDNDEDDTGQPDTDDDDDGEDE